MTAISAAEKPIIEATFPDPELRSLVEETVVAMRTYRLVTAVRCRGVPWMVYRAPVETGNEWGACVVVHDADSGDFFDPPGPVPCPACSLMQRHFPLHRLSQEQHEAVLTLLGGTYHDWVVALWDHLGAHSDLTAQLSTVPAPSRVIWEY